MKEDCMGDEILSGFAHGVILSKTLFARVGEHLQQCDDCLARLEALAKTADPLVDSLPALRALPTDNDYGWGRLAENIVCNLQIDSEL